MAVDVAHHLTGCKQEGAYTEVGCGVGIDYLSWDRFFSDGLHVSYASIGLQSYGGEVVPRIFDSGEVFLFAEEAVVDPPKKSVSEEGCSASLGARSMIFVIHTACPISFRLLAFLYSLSHFSI